MPVALSVGRTVIPMLFACNRNPAVSGRASSISRERASRYHRLAWSFYIPLLNRRPPAPHMQHSLYCMFFVNTLSPSVCALGPIESSRARNGILTGRATSRGRPCARRHLPYNPSLQLSGSAHSRLSGHLLSLSFPILQPSSLVALSVLLHRPPSNRLHDAWL